MQQLEPPSSAAWEARSELPSTNFPAAVRAAVEHVITELNNGTLRVATRGSVANRSCTANQEAVLPSVRLTDYEHVQAGSLGLYDNAQSA